MRPPFLVLPPVCVFLAAAAADYHAQSIGFFSVFLVLFGSIAAHISVNALNEYEDFKSGLDFKTIRTPFSGGTGTLPENPDAAPAALATGIITLVLTVLVGIYFMAVQGIWLLLAGIPGILIIYFYTSRVTRNPLFCLIAPGLGFGLLMVMGADYALTGRYSLVGFWAALVPFFLVSDLLLLNQFPDKEADTTVGRRHLLILLGKKDSALVYVFFLVMTYLSVVAGVVFHVLPAWALLGLVSAPLAARVGYGVIKHAEDREKLLPFMGMNVVLNVITPILVGIGLFIG